MFATSSKGKASSNFTYLLNELKKDNKNYEIKKFLGLSNELKRNLYRYYHLATAGTIFLESYYSPLYNVKLRKSTKVVQLWHACGGFKKFAYSSLGQGDANSEEFEYHAHKFYTHVMTSSDDTSIIYSEAFNLPLEKMHSLGVPRTDFFFNRRKMNSVRNEILEKYPELKNTKNVLYSPTFRGNPRER
ncbi:TPA: CDP-glycerol glycerophosphotransferase family protein, partial [Haemophilus influenzae]